MMSERVKKRLLVATIHFCLTIAVFSTMPRGFSGPPEREVIYEQRMAVCSTFLFILQPQLLMIAKLRFAPVIGSLNAPLWLPILLLIASVPIWSLCFAAIYCELVNWLKRVPLLGKKLF